MAFLVGELVQAILGAEVLYQGLQITNIQIHGEMNYPSQVISNTLPCSAARKELVTLGLF